MEEEAAPDYGIRSVMHDTPTAQYNPSIKEGVCLLPSYTPSTKCTGRHGENVSLRKIREFQGRQLSC